MAVKIPIYEQQTLPRGRLEINPNPTRIIPATNLMPDAIGRSVERFGGALENLSAFAEKIDNGEAATRVGDGISKANLEWTKRFNEAKTSAPLGASGFTDSLMEQFNKFAQDSLSNETNEHGRTLLSNGLNNLRESLFSKSYDFETKSRITLRTSQLDSTIQNWSKVVYQDPSQYGTAKTELMRTISNMDDLDATQKVELLHKRLPEIAQYATQGYINSDPKEAYQTIRQDEGYSPGFEGAVKFTLKHEGGLNVSDTNKTPSNFGINQAAHPGIDVKNLTKEGATDIYRKEYWNGIGGDRLAAKDPKLAMIAFDTAVIAGVSKAKQFLDRSDGDAAKYMEMRADFLSGLLKSDPGKYGKYAQAWSNRNRELRNQLLPEGTPHMTGQSFVDDLPPEKMLTYQRMAETQFKQVTAVDNQAFKANLQNSVAMYSDGVIDPNPLPKDQFVQAFGDEEGNRQYEQYVDLQDMGQNLSQMQSMSVSEIEETLQRNRAKPGPGYEAADKRFGIMQQAAARSIKLREDDPANYVLKTSKPVQDAYNVLSETLADQNANLGARQASAIAYANASMAEQTRLGVSSPQLLSKPYIESVQKTFAQAQTGEAMVSNVQGLENLWGQYWPKVYSQLIKEKAIPQSAMVIGSGMVGQAANDLAMASKIKEDDFLQGVPDSKLVKQDVTMGVDKALQPFRESMIGSDGKQLTIGGTDTFNVFYDETRRLALYYASQGMSPNDAATKAANATVMDRYSFVTRGGPYRVPKQLDADKVSEGAGYYLANIDPANLQMPATLRKDRFVMGDVAKSIKSNGYWVTAPDESGLVLFHADTRAPIIDANGKPIQYTWQQLTNYSKPQGKSDTTFGSGLFFQ